MLAQTGETEELRTRHGKRWRVSPTVRRVVSCVGPIHYQADPFDADDDWQEIDLDVLPVEGQAWDYECESNGYQVRLAQEVTRGGNTYRYAAEYRRAGRWLRMAPIAVIWTNNAGQRQVISAVQGGITPVIDNEANTVTWEDAFGEGLHWRYNLRPDQFAKTLIVTAKDNLPAPTIKTNGLRLAVIVAVEWDTGASASNGFASGVTTGFGDGTINQPDETVDDPATFSHDDERGSLWHWQAPRAWDSAEDRHDVAVAWRLLRKGNAVYAIFTVTASQLNNSATVYPVFIDPAISEQVAASGDDGYWRTSGSSFNSNNPQIRMGKESSLSTNSFCRFTTVAIPSGVSIDQATIELSAWSDGSGTVCNLTISLVDEADATAPTSAADANGRTTTTATTAWSSLEAWSANSQYITPDFSPSVQEVIDGSWTENNALVVYFLDNGSTNSALRQAHSIESLSGANAPVLDVTYTSAVEGDAAQSLPSLTQSASGQVVTITSGDIAQTLPSLGQSAAGEVTLQGDIAQQLPSLSQSASGEVIIQGTAAQALPSLTQAATGQPLYQATIAQTLPALSQAASGEVTIAGDAAQTLPSLTQAATGQVSVQGDGVQTLPRLTQAATGQVLIQAAGAQTLPSLTQALAGEVLIQGDGAQSLPALTQSAAGSVVVQGDAAQTLPAISQTASGGNVAIGNAAQALPALTQAASGQALIQGQGVSLLRSIVQAATGVAVVQGTAAHTLPSLAQSAAGEVIVQGEATCTLPSLTQSLTTIAALVPTQFTPLRSLAGYRAALRGYPDYLAPLKGSAGIIVSIRSESNP